MVHSTDARHQIDANLPETVPIDGSGNDKYYIPPDEIEQRRYPNSEHENLIGTFAEHDTTLPERTYRDGEKEAFQISYPVGYLDQRTQNTVLKDETVKANDQHQHFRVKRWHLVAGAVLVLIVIILVVVLGVVLSKNKDTNTNSSTDSQSSRTSSTADAESAVGGYLESDFYAKSGAWNGTAIAGSQDDDDAGHFLFYQDYKGNLASRWALSNGDLSYTQVNKPIEGDHKAMNGTPISVAKVSIGDITQQYHLFYVDTNFMVRERIMINDTGTWQEGPLSRKNLKTFAADRVGISACPRANLYGEWSDAENGNITAAITIWFASDENTAQQYSWTNGTQDWVFEQQFDDVDGHASFGCQTWDTGATEYIFFVNSNQEVGFYWRDNNHSVIATPLHPVGQWTSGTLFIQSVYKASPIAYTNALVYQSIDHTVRGYNISFAAENTTLAAVHGLEDPDHWILNDGNHVNAMGGTQLIVQAVPTGGRSASFLAFFQEKGNDISLYTRDVYNESAVWTKAYDAV